MKYLSPFSIIVLMCFNFLAHEVRASDEGSVEYSINRYTQDIDLSFKRGTIKIQNHFGDVHLKNTNAHQVGISVVSQELGLKPAIHELLIKNKKESLDITVHYQNNDIIKHKNKTVDWPIGRVDLVVFVPKDMTVDIQTTNGVIDVRKTKNWIKATSHSGKIDIANHYDIEASSVSGIIKVFPMSTQWKKGINLESKSSSIYAVVPNSDNVKLNIVSHGQLKSRLDSPENWKTVNSNKYREKLSNYQIKSQSGDVFISPHDQLK